MWKAIGASAVLLVVILGLSLLQSGRPGLDPKDQLAFERQRAEHLRELIDRKTSVPPALACVASRSNAMTVRTLYLVWLNRRPDLTTVPERDDASQEVERLIAACGGDLARLEEDAHRNGLDLDGSAAQAMLLGGR